MARKRTVKAADKAEGGKGGGASGGARPDPGVASGIWGVVYLSTGALLLISMLFSAGKTDAHPLGRYFGTALALGIFYLFGRVASLVFSVAVGYIGVAKLANKPLRVKLLLWCALLALELCVLLATVMYMPQLSAAKSFWAAMDDAGLNFVGMAVVNCAFVPLFGAHRLGPLLIFIPLMAITVMVGLRVKPRSVLDVLYKGLAVAAAWTKKAFLEIKTGIENSPDIVPESPPQSTGGDSASPPEDVKAPKENAAPKASKKEKDNNAGTPVVDAVDTDGQDASPSEPERVVSPDTSVQGDGDNADGGATRIGKAGESDGVDAVVNPEEKPPEVLTPEEEARRRLDEELSEFRRKRSEPIKILTVETPEVEPTVDEEDDDDIPIVPIIPSKRPLIVDADTDDEILMPEADVDIDTNGIDNNADSETGDGFKVSEIKEPAKPYDIPSPDIIPDPPPPTDGIDEETIHRNSAILEKALMNFGVEGKVICVSPGPVVTRYEIELAPGVKVSKVVNLHNDISMAVSGQKIRIQAPIPGKSAIGIELPNPKRQTVYFKNVLQSDTFRKSTADIPVVIGTNISGAPYITDIAKMPHVLIAGQTGAGKSVCINSLVCSMLMTKKPEELRLIMIDPKKVELACYSDIPHLLAPVVTEPKEAVKALQWGVQEMERRYRVLAKVGAKKLETFNERFDAGKLNGVLDDDDNKRLPFIVIIVDELADLMMTASKDVESQIQRIAQLARAVGIHLIVATQRPSVDIITGKIKANLASRIAFRTIQSVDSKTILGYVGAEKLLGMGDMLFLRNGANDIERFHGSFISEEDVEKITDAIKAQQVNVDKIESFGDLIGDGEEEGDGEEGGGQDDGKRDKLFAEAAQIVVSIGQGSTSLLQRRLGIGFARAGRVMDQLERAGIVGPANKSKVREVLTSAEDLAALLKISPGA